MMSEKNNNNNYNCEFKRCVCVCFLYSFDVFVVGSGDVNGDCASSCE